MTKHLDRSWPWLPLLVAAAIPLAGCSTLQIDVDVYKGPLANNEELQREQLLSMTMSARSLMFNSRNSLLDKHFAGWDGRCGMDARQRVLTAGEIGAQSRCLGAPDARASSSGYSLNSEAKQEGDVSGVAGTSSSRSVFPSALKQAAQLNDILNFYEPAAPAGLREEIARVQASWSELVGLRRFDDDTAKKVSADLLRDFVLLLEASWSARESRRQEAGGRGGHRAAAGDDAVFRAASQAVAATVREAIIGEVQTAAECKPVAEGGEVAPSRISFETCLLLYPEKVIAAISQVIQGDPQRDGTPAQRKRPQSLRQALSGAPPVAWQRISQEASFFRDIVSLVRTLPGLAKPAEVRGATPASPATDSAGLESGAAKATFARALRQMLGVEASGFSAGRLPEGIDQLADEYVAKRDAWIRAGYQSADAAVAGGQSVGAKPGAADKRNESNAEREQRLREAAEAAFSRLEHMAADVAGRMQFLATNLWLTDQSQDSKKTMEAVANTLLAHIDDLMRQRQFTRAARQAEGREARAVRNAWTSDGTSGVKQLLASLDAQIAAVESAASAAGAGAVADRSKLSEASKKLDELRTAREGKSKELEAAALRSAQGDALSLLLGISAPKTAEASDSASELKGDAERFKRVLARDPVPTSQEAMRQRLAASIEEQQKSELSPARSKMPRARRLKLAFDFLESFLKPMPNDEEPLSQLVPKFNAGVSAALRLANQEEKDLREVVAQLNKDVQSRTAEIEAIEKRLGGSTAPAGFGLNELRKAREWLNKLKDKVLELAEGANGAGKSLLELYREALALGQAPEADRELTIRVLASLPSPSGRLSLAAERGTAIDVMDDVIAQLRHRYLESIRTIGPSHATTEQLRQALEAARIQREDMLYLRSSTAYLRSTQPVTSLQSGNENRWSNLLFNDATRTPSDFLQWIQKGLNGSDETRTDREALDKANWQNINSVRVGGAGGANYVIVKDDVGNWYVKSMGVDPSAMIRSAKQMALFGAGAPFDVNLLRVDELRQKVDAAREGEKGRDAAEQELSRLTGKDGSAGVASRNDAIGKYGARFAQQGEDLRKRLLAQVEGDALEGRIRERWTASLKDLQKPAELEKLLEASEIRRHKLAALEALTDKTKPVVDANIEGLTAINSFRTGLKARVLTMPAFVTGPESAHEEKQTKVRDQRAVLLKTVQDEQAAADALAALEAEVAKSTATTGSVQGVDLANRVGAARADYTAKLKERRRVEELVNGLEKELAALVKTLSAAKDARALAAGDVDAVVKPILEAAIRERLRYIAETETAVKVLGAEGP